MSDDYRKIVEQIVDALGDQGFAGKYRKIIDGKLGVPKWEREDADLTEAQQQIAEYKRAIESLRFEMRVNLDALDAQKRQLEEAYNRRITKLQGKIAELEKGETSE